MTNGELFFKTFPCLEQDEKCPNILWWIDEKGKRQILGDVYDSDFWNAEYKESTTQEPRWISVGERLPKAGESVGGVAKYYLVQNEYGDMLVARYTHNEHWEEIYQLEPIADEIIAWRELPKPYKAESEE